MEKHIEYHNEDHEHKHDSKNNHEHRHIHKDTLRPIYKCIFTIVFVPLCLISIKPYIIKQIDLRGASYMGYKYDESIRQYKKIAFLDKNNVKAKNWLAYSYKMIKDGDNAIRVYSEVIAIDPDNHDALLNLGLILALDGKFREAIPYFEKLIQLGDNSVLEILAVCHSKLGELDKARDLLKEVLKHDPGNKKARSKLAEIESKLGR